MTTIDYALIGYVLMRSPTAFMVLVRSERGVVSRLRDELKQQRLMLDRAYDNRRYSNDSSTTVLSIGG